MSGINRCSVILSEKYMSKQKTGADSYDQVFAQQQEYIAKRASGYREQALKIYPWICGRCRREFTHRNLSELTVHHVDHNHGNNPSDGSNWELLCLYCHDEEHSKFENFVRYGSTQDTEIKTSTYNPFADLKDRMQQKK
jgi:hypothetical protein